MLNLPIRNCLPELIFFSMSNCTRKAFETDLMLGLLPDLSEQDMNSFLPEVPHIKPRTICLLFCEAGFDIDIDNDNDNDNEILLGSLFGKH